MQINGTGERQQFFPSLLSVLLCSCDMPFSLYMEQSNCLLVCVWDMTRTGKEGSVGMRKRREQGTGKG